MNPLSMLFDKVFHSFEFFILNNKAVFCDDFADQNLKKVYLVVSFSVLHLAVR